MKNKLHFLILFIVLFFQDTYSQITIQTAKPDTISHWKKKNEIGFDLSQIAFVNWSIGGNSAITALFRGQAVRTYTLGNINWNNEMIVRYGINKQDKQELRKTDDAFQINSTFGYRSDTISRWFHGSKFNFNTQFTNGYNYPNTRLAISKPFAPAFVFLGLGSEYSDKARKLTIYLSPLTEKVTFVLDERLANQGSFGVQGSVYDGEGVLIKKGRHVRNEIGIFVTNYWYTEVYNNIYFENRLSLYTDYIHRFGNIDIDWEGRLDLVVNEYVRANLGVHVLYDDDIKTKRDIDGQQVILGPRIQLKQMISLGMAYVF